VSHINVLSERRARLKQIL